ncbi:acyltransferase [Caballeronia fortuita]|uniref:Acyltransferase n=2 Tax=Caballeronia fortuita TaxID=1777138 RepID=A0A158DFS4_9BURK|nr:acyltransferase [Caballeronia fortuita]
MTGRLPEEYMQRMKEDMKNVEIEGMRGIAALLVLFNHIPFASGALDPKYVALFGFVKDTQRFLIPGHCGSLGVQLFFCITGYLFWKRIVVSGKATDWAQFYRNRFLRLAPAYILFAITMMLTLSAIDGFVKHVSLKDLAHDVFAQLALGIVQQRRFNGIDTTMFNTVTWTLPYEWGFYVLLPLLAGLRAKRWTTNAGLAVLALMLLVYDARSYLLLFFLSGALAAEMRLRTRLRPLFGSVAFCLLAFADIIFPKEAVATAIATTPGISSFADVAVYLVQWILVSAAFFVAIGLKPYILRVRPLILLGTISYSLYLLHLTVLQISIRIADKLQPIPQWSIAHFWHWAIIATICSIGAAAVSYALVERPFLHRRRNERRSTLADQSA